MSRQDLARKFHEMCEYGLDKCPPSATLTLARKAISIVSIASPEWFIQTVGPFFYEKRKEIMMEDITYFVNRDWAEQRESWGFMGATLANNFETTCRQMVEYLINDKLSDTISISKGLLQVYSKYTQVCRAESQ